MADKQKNYVNEDQILSFLQEAVEKIKTEEDPLELNVYRRLFRKAVPLTLRSYFAAYLLKQIFSGKMSGKFNVPSRNDRSGKQGRRDRNEGREGRENRQDQRSSERPEELQRGKQGEGRRSEGRLSEGRQNESVKPETRPVLPDDVSTTLFVSIGRNRRVYPRDLIGLIMQKVEMDREHIGDIRVLDNYSFVQVITEDAPRIIEALNEFEYRGRKLAVSYSRKREESTDEMHEDISGETGSSAASIPESDDDSSWKAESDLPENEENNGNI